MVSGAFLSLAGIALTVARIRPTLEMVKPLFETVPEVSSGKQVITGISGGIELNHISFRYNENMPLVLDDLSLKIQDVYKRQGYTSTRLNTPLPLGIKAVQA